MKSLMATLFFTAVLCFSCIPNPYNPITTLPSGMVVYAKTAHNYSEVPERDENGVALYIEYTDKLNSVKLARNWKHPEQPGLVLKADTTVGWYRNGAFKYFMPARDWHDTRAGFTIKGGKWVNLYESGRYKSFGLAEDFKVNENFTAKEGMLIYLREDGALEGYTPLQDMPLKPGGPIAKQGKKLLYYPNGRLKYLVLAEPWLNPELKITFAQRSAEYDKARVEFYSSGAIQKVTIIEDTFYGNGKVHIKGGTAVEFWEDGSIKAGLLAAPHTRANGATVQLGMPCEFSQGTFRMDRK